MKTIGEADGFAKVLYVDGKCFPEWNGTDKGFTKDVT